MTATVDFIGGLVDDAGAALTAALQRAYERGRADSIREIAGLEPLRERPTPTRVLAVVASEGGTSVDAMVGTRGNHSRRQCRERSAAAVILHQDCLLSLSECAEILGYLNHSTVSYHLARWTKNTFVFDLVRRSRRRLALGIAL